MSDQVGIKADYLCSAAASANYAQAMANFIDPSYPAQALGCLTALTLPDAANSVTHEHHDARDAQALLNGLQNLANQAGINTAQGRS